MIGTAASRMVPPCKACPVPLNTPWDGGPAGSIDTKHPARLAPRFISGTGIVVPGTKAPALSPRALPIPRKKRTSTGKTRGQMAHFNLSVPPKPEFFCGDISWHRFFTWCLAVPLTPGRGGGPVTSVDISSLPARPPPPSAILLRLPKKGE